MKTVTIKLDNMTIAETTMSPDEIRNAEKAGFTIITTR